MYRKMFKFTIVACLLVAPVVLGAVSRYPPEEKPAFFADQRGCWVKSLQLLLPYNMSMNPRRGIACYMYFCQPDGTTLQETCGSIEIRDGCERAAGDLSKEYPQCCDFEIC